MSSNLRGVHYNLGTNSSRALGAEQCAADAQPCLVGGDDIEKWPGYNAKWKLPCCNKYTDPHAHWTIDVTCYEKNQGFNVCVKTGGCPKGWSCKIQSEVQDPVSNFINLPMAPHQRAGTNTFVVILIVVLLVASCGIGYALLRRRKFNFQLFFRTLAGKGCKRLGGNSYVDNHGHHFTVEQDGCSVQFEYEGYVKTGTWDGNALKIHGWSEGTVQSDGNVKFADGGMWTKKEEDNVKEENSSMSGNCCCRCIRAVSEKKKVRGILNQAREVKESAKALARRSARLESESAGVSVNFLSGEILKSLACGRTGKSNPTFHDMAASFFHGPHAIGRDVSCPRDGKMGCAFIDTLPAEDRKTSNFFLSWVWSYSLLTFQEALSLWAEQSRDNVDPEGAFFFVCFFCNNQYRIIVDESSNGSDDLETVFEARLLSCGRVIALMDDWKKPVYCTRIWTIYEQFVAAKLDVPTEIILPRKASASLLEQLMRGKHGIEDVSKALGEVRSKDAVASRKVDEIKVKGMIEGSVGFDAVDDKVVSRLVKVAVQRFQEHLGRNINDHRRKSNEESAGTSWFW